MELGSGWMHPTRSGGEAAGATKDAQFVLEYFRLMSASRVDFTDTWRALLDVPALSMTRESRRFAEASMQSGAGDAVEGGEARSDVGQGSGRDCASGNQEVGTWGTNEALRPLRSILMAAGASGEQMREWAAWVHEYSSRIDTQGIGKFHPDGEAEGRRERLDVMRKSNPAFILRAATLEQALKSAEIGGERMSNIATTVAEISFGSNIIRSVFHQNRFLSAVFFNLYTRNDNIHMENAGRRYDQSTPTRGALVQGIRANGSTAADQAARDIELGINGHLTTGHHHTRPSEDRCEQRHICASFPPATRASSADRLPCLAYPVFTCDLRVGIAAGDKFESPVDP